MIIDLRQFEDFPAQAVIEASDGEIQPFDELITQVGQTTLRLEIQKSGAEYFCQGTVMADVRLQCSRCAMEFDFRLDGDTDFIIRTEEPDRTDDSEAADNEDYVYASGTSETAEVADLVRQALALAMPMKPLCSENCRGICPVCRANLNERSCSCVRKQSDPRWDGLRNLLRD